jgi:hypothetical protein
MLNYYIKQSCICQGFFGKMLNKKTALAWRLSLSYKLAPSLVSKKLFSLENRTWLCYNTIIKIKGGINMKKVLSLIILASLCILLVSCNLTSTNVKSVYIDDSSILTSNTHSTIYLYSFKDAKISTNYESTTSKEIPSSKGYIYSSEELKVGDSIKVWTDFKFGSKTSSWSDDREYGVDAIVSEIVEIYNVKVKKTSDTYIITYYSVKESLSKTSVSKKENLAEIQMHKVEVTKDKVVIEHNT